MQSYSPAIIIVGKVPGAARLIGIDVKELVSSSQAALSGDYGSAVSGLHIPGRTCLVGTPDGVHHGQSRYLRENRYTRIREPTIIRLGVDSVNSYEVVRRAITFDNPDRLPCEFWSMGVCDTHWAGWNQIGTGDNSRRETYDEWGCLWARTEMTNMGQVKGHPLSDWSFIDKFRWPDPEDPSFYDGMEKRFKGSDGKYIKTGFFMLLFERMHALRGFENTLMDLYLERENIEMLADRIVEFDIAVIENISRRFPGQIHAMDFTDDWGTELATFISPKLWDEFFKPRYKKIFAAMKSAGWFIHMHSCGKVNEIIPGLIEAGVDVFNLQQPRALGIEEIGQQFAGKVSFAVTCDIQHTLPFKGQQEIEEEASLLLNSWGTEKGGIILSEYGDGRAIGVDNSKKKYMFDAFMKHDRWKRA